jgi:ribosomal protein S1
LPEFDRIDSLPTPPESAWPAIKHRLSAGTPVTGVVIARQTFGIFLDLGDGALGLMERPSMPWHPGGDRMASPDIGTEVTGEVVDHMDNNRQVRVVASDPWSDHQHE